jgi:hypothetical protein
MPLSYKKLESLANVPTKLTQADMRPSLAWLNRGSVDMTAV